MGVKLGDSGGFFTWMRYRRWPFFGVLFSMVGAVVFAVLYGWLGLFGGLLGGGIVGALLGALMGKDKKMFPVQVHKYATYASGIFEPLSKSPGRIVTQTVADERGGQVERRILEYLERTTLRQLPNFSLSFWEKQNDQRVLRVLQTDSNTFLPITMNNGVVVAHDVPVYQADEKGNILRFSMRVGQDGKMEEVADEKGYAKQIGFSRQELFNSNMAFEEERGGVVAIPKGLAAKADNERTRYTDAVRMAALFNRTGGFWQKYGHLATAFLSIFAMIIIVILSYNAISGSFQHAADTMSLSLQGVADQNTETARINTAIAQALIRYGFNGTLAYYAPPARPTGATPTPQPGNPTLSIPFIS